MPRWCKSSQSRVSPEGCALPEDATVFRCPHAGGPGNPILPDRGQDRESDYRGRNPGKEETTEPTQGGGVPGGVAGAGGVGGTAVLSFSRALSASAFTSFTASLPVSLSSLPAALTASLPASMAS